MRGSLDLTSHQPGQMWLGGPGVDDEVDGVRCLGMPRAQSNGLPGQSLRA